MKDLEKQIEISADNFADIEWRYSDGYIVAESVKQYFIEGAKSEAAKEYWQQGMYTEEEVKKAYIQGVRDYCRSSKGLDSFLKTEVNIWFEQNKKK